MRYFFEIGYNGKNYNGWQTQHTGIGIQAVVEKSMGVLLRRELEIVCSGRTDAGVHCERQFFHCDIDGYVPDESFLQKLNALLPADIVIRSAAAVDPAASARYDAIERTYRYQLTRKKNPLLAGYAWHYFKVADVPTMNHAASLLIGEHDFACFSKVKTNVKHFLCDVKHAAWEERGDMLLFHITANRFLRGMVRAIVGTLLDVGSGKTSVAAFREILASKDRKRAGANVPAYGLFFVDVKYPARIFKP